MFDDFSKPPKLAVLKGRIIFSTASILTFWIRKYVLQLVNSPALFRSQNGLPRCYPFYLFTYLKTG